MLICTYKFFKRYAESSQVIFIKVEVCVYNIHFYVQYSLYCLVFYSCATRALLLYTCYSYINIIIIIYATFCYILL
jgi:hypothetical protein